MHPTLVAIVQGGQDHYLGFINTSPPPLSVAEALKKWSASRDGLCPPRCACLQPHQDWGVRRQVLPLCAPIYTRPELGLSSSRATRIGKSAPCSIHVARDCSELIEGYKNMHVSTLFKAGGQSTVLETRRVRDVTMLPRSLLRNRCRGLVCGPNGELWTAARAGMGC